MNWDQESGEVKTDGPNYDLGGMSTGCRPEKEGGEIEDGSTTGAGWGGW